jgi:hypothetical protein
MGERAACRVSCTGAVMSTSRPVTRCARILLRSLRRRRQRGCAVGQPRSRVGGIGNRVPGPHLAAAKQAGSETLGEWMDRHRLSRDEVASRLTKELGKPISAKAVVMFRNRPSPNSWGEALARSEHAPPEAEPHSEWSPLWERAEINGGPSTHLRRRPYVGRPTRPTLAFSWLAALVRSDDSRWLLFASACGLVVGLAIALTLN